MRTAVAIVAMTAMLLAPAALRAANPPVPMTGHVTPEQTEAAIRKAIAFLYAHENNGLWENPQPTPGRDPWFANGGQWGGTTALATYALLAAGENSQDPNIVKAINFLRTAPIIGTYALAMRLNVCEELPDQWKSLSPIIEHDGTTLLNYMHTGPVTSGFYFYDDKHDLVNGPYDHSNSQIAVLGLWAAEQCGFEISDKYWDTIEKAWIREQDPSGGWNYSSRADTAPKASMTAAGVATLFITQDMLRGFLGVDCRGNLFNPYIEAGRKWLGEHFNEVADKYTWYGIERVGAAGGYKYIGTIDWFKAGADALVRSQLPDGSWGTTGWGPTNGQHTGEPWDTCFALIFPARGRAPVIMNKLEYQLDQHGDKPKMANWNERPRDCHNFVRWAGHQTEGFFNWQIVNLQAPPEDLHDAPILYITGDHQGLSFTSAEEAKLKAFVEQGGLIIGNADCGSRSEWFSKEFKKLGEKLFSSYEFRRLPKDHLIYHEQFDSKKWPDSVPVDTLGNGARELMMLVPVSDPSRYWQTEAFRGHEGCFELMLNIYFYATDKLTHYKGDTYILALDPAVTATRAVKVARIQYGANWDPEPGGWRRLAVFMHNQEKTDLTVESVELGKGQLAGYKIAHMTGTTSVTLSQPQLDELKSFVHAGGTLIVDSCGGIPTFAASMRDQLGALFGPAAAQQLTQPLPASSPAFSSGSVNCSEIGYRAAAMRVLGSMRVPRVRGIDVAGRIGVFFSPEDLSAALVGQQIDGIYGYQPQATRIKDKDGKPTGIAAGASELMSSLILYASSATPPASQPATKP